MADEGKAYRFKRLEHIFHSAKMMDAAARANYLDRVCGSDEMLRREVEDLLAAQPLADDFLSVPATDLEARRRAGELAQQSFEDKLPVKRDSLIGHAVNQYEIVALLGFGGMGEVWLAEDTRLKRKVALKLLPEEFTKNADRVRRFEQEAHAVSALNHPNIITLFDFGHAEEGYFITTEFVDGKTLRERLRESASLSAREAIEIVLQICAALAAAHVAGVIHRDIKPENVMLRRDGIVKVLDFGLAKMSEDQTLNPNTSASSLTNPGVVMGTVSYMSPEQARGQKVDARTDIFSLGITLYEMVTGRLPFEGETTSDMLAAILKSEPLPLPVVLNDDGSPSAAPVALQYAVRRALTKDREQRYQTIRTLADDLKQCGENLQFKTHLALSKPRVARGKLPMLAVMSLLFALAIGLAVWRALKPAPPMPSASAPIKTLAVLPFRFYGGQQSEEYLGLGMADALITKLSSARQLTVRPTNAVLKYRSVAIEPERAASELKTDAVIDGSVQKVGDNLRVTLQLIHAGQARPLWVGDFDGSASAPFALQDKLAARVIEELELGLTGAERQQFAKHPTTNAEAWRLYLQGRYVADKRTTEGTLRARGFFERAVALDPKFAGAYAELAICWSVLGEHGAVPPSESLRRALPLVVKAVELDDTLAEAHAYLGFLKLGYAWDLPGAEVEFQRALNLNPQQKDARQFHGVYLLARGRAEEGIAESRRAVELDPTSLIARSQLARALYLGRRYDDVIAVCEELLQMDKNHAQAYNWLAQARTQHGNHTEAIAALEKANELASGRVEMLAALGHAYAAAGRVTEARRIIAELQGRIETVGATYFLATVYAQLGERSAALEALEIAYRRRDPGLILRSKLDPKLDPLRNDPGFISLLQRIGL